MDYETTKSLTHDELSVFNYSALTLDKLISLQKIISCNKNNMSELILEKLRKMCLKSLIDINNSRIFIPKDIKNIDLSKADKGEIEKIITFIASIFAIILDKTSNNHVNVVDINLYIGVKDSYKTAEYINNGLYYDITTIIEEIRIEISGT